MTRSARAFSKPALFALALSIGCFAYGGGFAVIGRIKHRVVDDFGWMTADEFAEAVAVTAALPGVNSANIWALVGAHHRAPFAGAVATLVFLIPGTTAMLAFAIFYEQLRQVRGLGGVLEGMTAAVVGILAGVADDFAKNLVKTRRDAALVAVAFAMLASHWLGLTEVVAIAAVLGAALAGPSTTTTAPPTNSSSSPMWLLVPAVAVPSASLLLVFAKISIATFGGGVAMIPAVEHEVLARGWVDSASFTDAVTFAQITPGPIATTATFLGYRIGGFAGAAMATLGVFVPPLGLTMFVAQSLPKVREQRRVRGALSWVSIVVVAAIAAAAFAMYRVGVHGVLASVFAAGVFVWRRRRPQDSLLWGLAAGAVFGITRAFFAR